MRITQRLVKLVTNDEASGQQDCCHWETVRSELGEMGLTEFEICNLINIRPKSLVCLQVVVDEMVDRLSSEQMSRILALFEKA